MHFATMLNRWRTLPFLLFGLVSTTLAAPSQAFENTAIVRTVDLGGALVHVTTTFAVKALQANQKVYTIALGVEEVGKTSWLEVKLKGQADSLTIEEHPFDSNRCVAIFRVGVVSYPYYL